MKSNIARVGSMADEVIAYIDGMRTSYEEMSDMPSKEIQHFCKGVVSLLNKVEMRIWVLKGYAQQVYEEESCVGEK